ncbi:HNH endonuclease [Aureimonas fodinaquatilis]|nr:HNH endonuclease signature motif containing protein [Aureimonas fodinaquatilis]
MQVTYYPRWFRRKIKREHLWQVQAGRCFYCDCEMAKSQKKRKPNTATFDHIVPKSAGGKHEAGNILLACYECNSAKADMPASEFLKLRLGGGDAHQPQQHPRTMTSLEGRL